MKKLTAASVAGLVLLTGVLSSRDADATVLSSNYAQPTIDYMHKHMNYLKEQSQHIYQFTNHTKKTHDPYEYVGTIQSKYQGAATAIAINPTTVITVKHTVIEGAPSSNARVITNPQNANLKYTPIRNREKGNMTFDVAKIYAYPVSDRGGHGDIAVLKLKKPLPLKNYAKLPTSKTFQQMNTGDHVKVIGYPDFGNKNRKVGVPYISTGDRVISGLNGAGKEDWWYTGLANPGYSGAPVINSKNEVIGLHRGGFAKNSELHRARMNMAVNLDGNILKFVNKYK